MPKRDSREIIKGMVYAGFILSTAVIISFSSLVFYNDS